MEPTRYLHQVMAEHALTEARQRQADARALFGYAPPTPNRATRRATAKALRRAR